MKTGEIIYRFVVLIAILGVGYFIWTKFDSTSSVLDKIDKDQQEIMNSAKKIIEDDAIYKAKADSLDSIRIEEIRGLKYELTSVKGQLKTVEKELTSYKKTFDQNKIDLPNPWKE